jgi:hypothetical protein
MIKFVYKILPVFVFYTDKFIKPQHGGISLAIFCFIRPKYKSDEGLLQHELTHSRQFYRNPILHLCLYRFWDKYKLECEVEGYKVQLKYYPTDLTDLFAGFIAERYELDITKEKAKELLSC